MVGSELSQSTFATSRSSIFGHTATSTAKDTHTHTHNTQRTPHSSSFLALLNPLRPVSLAKPPTPTPTSYATNNSSSSSNSQQMIPEDWRLERLKATDEIPHPIPSRWGEGETTTRIHLHPLTLPPSCRIHHLTHNYTTPPSITSPYPLLHYLTLYYTTLPSTTLHPSLLHHLTYYYTTLPTTTPYYTIPPVFHSPDMAPAPAAPPTGPIPFP